MAKCQHGVATRAQLASVGVSPGAIDHRLRAGRLQAIHPGVYAVGIGAATPEARALAAVLACGDGTVLSHRSAAALWRLLPAWPARIEVTARHRHRLRGVHAHRSRTLQVADAAIHHGIPVTAPARTLLDLADVLDDRRLARAVNEAQVLGRVRADELAALLDRSPGRRGSGRLRSQLSQRGGPTRSELEDCFLAFVREHGLPRPEVNRRVAGYEVDMLWRPERLVVELDGRAFHAHRFERDREKDAALLAAGFAVIRITWQRLDRAPAREAERLLAILAARRGPASPRLENGEGGIRTRDGA